MGATNGVPLSSRFALLIGVSDYAAFDRSAENPRGASDLFGPANNLAAMWDFCQALGYSAADVGLLASPLVPPRGGHPAYYAAATRDAVLAGVRLLAERLASSAQSQGLVYFSGHGDAVDGIGPVLCTEDTTVDPEGVLHNVVSLAEIAAILEAHAPGRGVTIVLDSCASGMPERATRRALGRLRGGARRDQDTLISATGPDQVGAELLVDGVWRGALTWALCTAAAPYARVRAGDFLVPDLSLGAWLVRARALLAGVSLDQAPQLSGDAGAVVLQPNGVPCVAPAGTLASQRRGHVEIYGDESGKITGDEPVWTTFALLAAGTNTVIGRLVESFATSPSTLAPYSDFWTWYGSNFFPDVFRMDFEGKGTQGVNSPPSNLPSGVPMWAFPAGLTNFGQFDPTGWTVWAITASSSPSNPFGYLVRNGSGALRWIVTSSGYTSRGKLLADLPSAQNNGGVMLSDNSGILWFTKITPSGNLTSCAPAYDVKAASGT